MKILIATYIFDPEPIVMSTIIGDLADKLAKEHEVTVVRSKPCRPYGYDFSNQKENDKQPYKVVMLDSYVHPKSSLGGRMRENFSFGKAVKRYIRMHHEEIDAVYMTAFPLFSQKIIIKEAEKYHIATVNHVEDIYPEPFIQIIPVIGKLFYKILLPIDKWIMRHATYSVVIGNKIREFFIRTRNASPDKVKVVYNWQDEGRFKNVQVEDRKDNLFTFMYVGSISRAANLHNVMQAYIDASIPNSRFVFAGSGNEKESLQKEALNYPNINISFIEAPSAKVAEIQSMADVLILPLKEGVALRAVPSKFAAYLFSKKPVIACVEQESDVAEIIRSGNCGWVVAPNSAEQLGGMMKKVALMDREKLKEMGVSGYAYSQEHLTREINLQKLADIMIEAAKKR